MITCTSRSGGNWASPLERLAGLVRASLQRKCSPSWISSKLLLERCDRCQAVLREFDMGFVRLVDAPHNDSRVVLVNHVARLRAAGVRDAQGLQLAQFTCAYQPP